MVTGIARSRKASNSGSTMHGGQAKLDLEAEAERLKFTDLVKSMAAKGVLLDWYKAPEVTWSEKDTYCPEEGNGKRRKGGGQLRVKPPPPVMLPRFAVSEYVVEFGHVVKGTVRPRRFKVQNCGWQVVQFAIDK